MTACFELDLESILIWACVLTRIVKFWSLVQILSNWVSRCGEKGFSNWLNFYACRTELTKNLYEIPIYKNGFAFCLLNIAQHIYYSQWQPWIYVVVYILIQLNFWLLKWITLHYVRGKNITKLDIHWFGGSDILFNDASKTERKENTQG